MTDIQKHIRDLIFFYVKTNYEKYLLDNKISRIDDDKISLIIQELYVDRKEHIKLFIKESLRELIKDEYPGDVIINGIIREIFEDDKLCKNRLELEIKNHQNKYKPK